MRDEDGRRSSYLALKTDKQKVYNSNIIVAYIIHRVQSKGTDSTLDITLTNS